jgi:hypothetical protein
MNPNRSAVFALIAAGGCAAVFAFWLGITHAQSAGASRAPIVYLSPNGSDANDGSSPATAIRSLARAEIIVQGLTQNAPADAEIRIAPGTYYDQALSWSYYMPHHTITFEGYPTTAARPVFDGCTDASHSNCPWQEWFVFTGSNSRGEQSNLVFNHLVVEDYLDAIEFRGHTACPNSSSQNSCPAGYLNSNGSNVIENSIFENIGTITVNGPKLPGAKPTNAISLRVSSNNIVRNNQFINVVAAGSMHALYVSVFSSNNQIVNNSFKNITGDIIKFRNASDDNVASGNMFDQGGQHGAVESQTCDKDHRTDCPNPGFAECPPLDNVVTNNTYTGGVSCAQLPMTYIDGGIPVPSGCPVPADPNRSIPETHPQYRTVSGNKTDYSACKVGPRAGN